MRYDSLKRQPVKAFRVGALDGGIDLKNSPETIRDNCVCDCVNMWYKDSAFCTRPGFKGDPQKVVSTAIYGYEGEYTYEITDTVVYYLDRYQKIAVAHAFVDEYAHYINVYLVDLYGVLTPIGTLPFMRYDSNEFHVPISIQFFNGRPQQGGGVFAMVALQNLYAMEDRIYKIYEIDQEFSEWIKVESYYIPTVYINGRGNKYSVAKTEKGLNFATPKTLESQNMLEGKFHAYYTSDSYSNTFRLPFNGIANKEVVCRVYSALDEYTEWKFAPGVTSVTRAFLGISITAVVDRKKGAVYFQKDGSDFPLPLIGVYPENNIKITACKEIEDGIAKIVGAQCTLRNNSKLLVAGGEGGNTIYVSDYENPLYFPKAASVDVGEGNALVTGMVASGEKILVFKEHELYAVKVKQGADINKISLLSDNDKNFKAADSFKVEQISKEIGCPNRKTIANCGTKSLWLSENNKVYMVDSSNSEIIEVTKDAGVALGSYKKMNFSAVGSYNHYILSHSRGLTVFDVSDSKNISAFPWQQPEGVRIVGGLCQETTFWFLCTGEDESLIFMLKLEGDSDTLFFYDQDGMLSSRQVEVGSGFTTKHYAISKKSELKNIESVYLSLLAKSRVKISINGIRNTDINFGFSNEDYDKGEFKSVKLLPHLQSVDTIFLKVVADRTICVKDIEFSYRTVG